MDKREYTHRMAIITSAGCFSGNRCGTTVLMLAMVCISGEARGMEIEKNYEIEDALPDYLKRDILRLGYRVETVEDLKEITESLEGIIVKVSLVGDGDALRVYIDDYFGRDNPKKYMVTGD